MYADCLKSATHGTVRNWIVLPATAAMLFLFMVVAGAVAPLGLLGGFILGLLTCMCITQYYSWLIRTKEGERIPWRSLLEFDAGLFQAVISAAFILWIIDFMVSSLLQGIEGARWFQGMVKLAIILVFNPLAEVVYLRGDRDLAAFQRAYQFTLQHWIEWFIPYVLIFAPLCSLGGTETALSVLSSTSALFPSSPALFALMLSFPSLLAAVLGAILVHWLMLFRGALFENLDTGNRRMRMFRYKNS